MTALLVFAVLMPFSVLGQQKDQNSGISLHQAALQGNLDAVKKDIESGTDLNQKDQYGSTPLIIASTFGKTEVAKALIDAGADMEIRDSNGSTPLIIATFFGRTEIVKDLLDKGVNKYARNNSGATALDIASTPFEEDKNLYDQLGAALGPLGLKLDYDQIKSARKELLQCFVPGRKSLLRSTTSQFPDLTGKYLHPNRRDSIPCFLQSFITKPPT
ncbi:MAG TPA: ankyrin repeat domain-containing protein [Balneolales bacterium]|nr:ankyrin repeat domain-containing protein [Balneolales bacterium]